MALSTWLAAWLITAPAGAALAPEWQRVREFHSVVDEGARLLGGRPIEAIERLDGGAYRVRGGGCEVVVKIVPLPQQMPGPQAFSLAPGKLSCP
ncbi:hypothetical protein HCU64_04555 [Methylobacterium sp. C25]|nr:hypothetical protein [Methylobacterium sp. C25]